MANPDILITPGQGTIGFSGTNTGTIQLRVAESGDIHFEGDQGSLLSLSDDLSDSLFSVNDAAGMPVFEVFADDTIKAYRNNEAKLEIDPDNNRVRLRDNVFVSGNLTVSGDITSASATHEATSYTASTHVSGLSGYFGKVGIGTTDLFPGNIFHVDGGTNGWVVFERNSKRLFLNANYAAGNAYAQVATYGVDNMSLSLSSDDTKPEQLFLKHDGGVGIGTTGPLALVDIASDDGTDHTDDTPDTLLRLRKTFLSSADKDSAVNFDVSRYIAGGNNRPRTRLDFVLAGDENDTYDNREPNVNVLSIRSDRKVGIGTTNPNNTLHVHTASAGSVTADTDRDDLVIENSANVGLTFLSPNTTKQAIAFGDPQNSRVGLITYDHAHDSLAIRANNTDNLLTVQSGGEVGVGGTGQHGALFTVHGDTSITGQLVVGGGQTAESIKLLRQSDTNPYISWYSDISTREAYIQGSPSHFYIVNQNNNNIELMTNGAVNFTVSPTATISRQNVGIGTTVPDEKLHIEGAGNTKLLLESTANHAELVIKSENNTYSPYVVFKDAGADRYYIQCNPADRLIFRPQGTSDESKWIVFDHQGNVGIGTDNPARKFMVHGGSARMGIKNSTEGVVLGLLSDDAGYLQLNSADGTTQIQLRADAGDSYITGQLGIGTKSPNSALEVFGQVRILDVAATPSYGARLVVGRDTAQDLEFIVDDLDCKIVADQDSDSDGNHNFILDRAFAGNGANNFQIQKDGTSQLLIDTDGKVGIGTTIPTKDLHVQYNVNNSSDIGGDGLLGGNAGNGLLIQNIATNGNSYANLDFRANNADGRIAFTYDDSNHGSFHFVNDVRGVAKEVMKIRGALQGTKRHSQVGIGTTNPTGALNVYQSGDFQPAFLVEGSQGSLFSVEDTLTGSLMSVNDIAGLPVFEAFDDGTIVMGQYNSGDLVVTGNKVGIGTDTPSTKLHVAGDIKSKGDGKRILLESNDYLVAALTRQGTSSSAADQGGLELYNAGATKVALFANTTSYINNGANFGIGTASPSTYLDVEFSDTTSYAPGNGNSRGLDITNAATDNNTQFASLQLATLNNTNGTASLVRIHAINENSTAGASSMAFTTRSASSAISEKMRIKGDGKVGIGTDDPATNLDVFGGAGTKPNDPFGGQNQLFISNGSTNNAGITIAADDGVNDIVTFIQSNQSSDTAYVGTQSSHKLVLRTNNNDRLTIDSSNTRVGIGTTSPSETLEINHSNHEPVLIKSVGNYNSMITMDSNRSSANSYVGGLDGKWNGTQVASIYLRTGGDTINKDDGYITLLTASAGTLVERMRIQSDGKVGIGTDAPATSLEVLAADPVLTVRDTEATVANASATLRLAESSATNTLNGHFDLKFAGSASGGDLDISRYNNTSLVAQGVRIRHDGNVGIGTTNPSSKLQIFGNTAGTAKLQIEGESGADPYINFLVNNTTHWAVGADDNRGDCFKISQHSALGTNDFFTVRTDGKVGIGTDDPDASFHLKKTTATQPFVIFEDAGTNSNPAVSVKNDAQQWQVQTVGARSDTFEIWDQTRGIGRFTVTTDGFVGIGDFRGGPVRPQAMLQVSGDASITGELRTNGNLGVGAPNGGALLDPLHISAGNPRIRLEDTLDTNNYSRILADNGQLTLSADEGDDQASSAIIFKVDNGEVMRMNGANVGIGTSPAHILEVYSSAPVINIKDGGVYTTNATPYLQFSDYHSYISRIGKLDNSNSVGLDLQTNSGHIHLNPAGNVGIGTDDPTYNLSVVGAGSQILEVNSTDSHASIIADRHNTSADANFILATNGTNKWRLAIMDADDTLQIYDDINDSVTTVFKAGGNVGIGTTGPVANLQIDTPAATSAGQGLRINRPSAGTHYHAVEFSTNGTVDWSVGQNLNDSFEVYENGLAATTRLSIKEGGNVGIGTTSPDGKLHIHTASAGSVTADSSVDDLVVENNNHGGISLLVPDDKASAITFGTPSDSIGAKIQWDNTTDAFVITTANNGAFIRFNTDNQTEAMRIDSSQNVGIGTAVPSGRLHVENNSTGIIVANDQITGNAFEVFGAQGNLLTVTDDLSDSLFSVNDAAGMPVFEVFADDTIKSYRNNESKLEVDPENNRIRLRDNVNISGLTTITGGAVVGGGTRFTAGGTHELSINLGVGDCIGIGASDSALNYFRRYSAINETLQLQTYAGANNGIFSMQPYGGEVHIGTNNGTAILGSLLAVDGDVQITGTLKVNSEIQVASNLKHLGDTDTLIAFSTDQVKITAGGTNETTFTASQTTINDDSRDVDFHVNGDNNTVLKVDAGSEFVDLATSKLKIGGSATADRYLKCTNSNGTVTFDALGWDDLPAISTLSELT